MPTHTNTDTPYDAQAAQRGYRETAADRQRFSTATPPRLDPSAAAILALEISRTTLRDPAIAQRFDLLHAELLERDARARIEPAAWALWYATMQRQSAEASSTDAKLSASLIALATETRQRMIKVLEYVHGDDAKIAAELADIRRGSGHVDLASDLSKLADLYGRVGRQLKDEAGPQYRPADRRRAGELAGRIVAELGQSAGAEAATWRKEQAAAFALLLNAYEKVRRFGIALFEADGEALFPSLWSVRAPRRAAAEDDDELPSDEREPSAPVPTDD